MSEYKKLYRNHEWYKFSDKVIKRDNDKCCKCGRSSHETTLQVHHKLYKPLLLPWEYPYSDCITLCKGCHATEHGILEPKKGWTLIDIGDLGGVFGMCEKEGCGHEIRYEHEIYHPLWGYMVVGSTCVEYLTEEDKYVSEYVLKIYNKVSNFLSNSNWEKGISKNKKPYIWTTHKHHEIRIYGNNNKYGFQICHKQQGRRYYDYQKTVSVYNRNLEKVKELSYIALIGAITENPRDKLLLRNIYRSIK